MTIAPRIIALGSIAALAACSSSGTSEPDIFAPYTPIYSTGQTLGEAASSDTEGDGIVGFVGLRDGRAVPIRVRISTDKETAFLSIDGSDEVAIPEDQIGFRAYSTLSGDYSLDSFGESSTSVISIAGDFENSSFVGRGGVQIPEDDLPAGPVTYSGGGGLESLVSVFNNATTTLVVDFGSNSITGSMDFLFGNAPTPFQGTISGSTSGSFLSATADVVNTDTDTDAGTLEFLGAFYPGEQVAGAIGGTVNGSATWGSFSLTAE